MSKDSQSMPFAEQESISKCSALSTDHPTQEQRGQTPTKFCSGHLAETPLTEFYRDQRSKDGLQRYCKHCYRNYQRKYRERRPGYALWANAKTRAQKQGLPFNIKPSDIVIPTHCPALGIPLRRGSGKITDASPTLDRIIPSKGYVRGNVIVVSNKANRMKSNASTQELLRAGCFYAQHYPTEGSE